MGEVPRLSKLSFPRLFSLRESPGSPATRGREGALVDHGFPAVHARTHWGCRSFLFPSLSEPSVLGGRPRHPEAERRLWSRFSCLPALDSLGVLEHFFLLARTIRSQRHASLSRGLEVAVILASLFTVPRFLILSGFFSLPCFIPRDWSQGLWPGGGWASSFVSCPPLSLGPFRVMRSTSSFEDWFLAGFYR